MKVTNAKLVTPNSATSFVALVALSLLGVLALSWPFFSSPDSLLAKYSAQAPWLMAAIVPVAILLVAATVLNGIPDARSLALLAVLIAVITAVRPLGAGLAGLEPIWAVIIIGGRALGPALGFALGSLGLLTSALVTGGVGPWLPFQMLVAGWVGLGAALIAPKARGRTEVILLAGYGAFCGLAVGWLLNLWFWPVTTSGLAVIGYDPGLGSFELLQRWVSFSLATSLSFDIPRAILTCVVVALVAGPALRVLRRATRRTQITQPAALAAEPALTAQVIPTHPALAPRYQTQVIAARVS